MNDKEYNIQKRRIQKLIKKWVKPIGLGWYRLKFNYLRDSNSKDDLTDYSPKSINGMWQSAFITCCDPYYMTATIDCSLNILQDIKDDDELEEYFIHELMHIFLAPMHSKETASQEEFVATKLAQAFFWINEKT